MKSILGLLCIATLVITPLVHAHGRLRKPQSRDALAGIPVYLQNFQTGYTPDFGCRGYPPVTPQTNLTAGSNLTVQWTFDANHPGDCFFYLSYDSNLDQSSQQWFKIAQFAECDKLNMQDQIVKIPDWIPACDHCVLRFEWYAIHMITVVEFYSQCVDVKIISSANPGYLGTPKVKVPCHLPPNNPAGTNNYRNAFEGPFFFTGPDVAVPDTNGTGQTPPLCPQTTPSPIPTTVPAPTPTPTPTPTATSGTGQACAGEWGQCGGNAYTGLANCCPQNWRCEYQSAWYSQCVPGTQGPTTTAAPTPTPSSEAAPTPSAPAPTPASATTAAPEYSTCEGAAPEWGKCAGIDFSLPKCCPTNWNCKYQSEWYSQCVPN